MVDTWVQRGLDPNDVKAIDVIVQRMYHMISSQIRQPPSMRTQTFGLTR